MFARRIRKLNDLRLGVTYDVGRRNGRPFRGRLLHIGVQAEEHDVPTQKYAVFVVDGEQVTVWEPDFTSAKPYSGKLFGRD